MAGIATDRRKTLLPLAAILAACGSFLPARSATAVPCVDYHEPFLQPLFRVGGSQSAFDPLLAGDLLLLPRLGAGLELYDVSDPLAPAARGALELPELEGIAVAGDLVFVARGMTGLTVVDISDPEAPVVAGTVDTPGRAVQVAAKGAVAYVADETSLLVVDATNPSAPIIVGTFPEPAGGANRIQDVAVREHHVFVAAKSAGILAVDVSWPQTPVLAGQLIYSPYGSREIVLVGSRAFLSGGPVTEIDVSDPADMRFVGTFGDPESGAVSHLSAGRGRVFQLDSGGAFVPFPPIVQVYDVERAGSPAFAGRIGAGNWSGIVAGDEYAYLSDWTGGFWVVRLGNGMAPPALGRIEPGFVYGVAVSAQRAYVLGQSDPYGGCGMVPAFLCVVDVSDPSEPRWLGGLDLATLWDPARDLAVAGAYAFVPEGHGLAVISVADPDRPRPVSSIALAAQPTSVALDGAYAYVSCGVAGLQIVDATDPAAPTLAGSYDTAGSLTSAAIRRGRAYLADGAAGLRILDLTNPSAPQLLGGVETPGSARGVAVSGNLAFIACGEAGLVVVNCENPAAPRVLSVRDTPGQANRVTLAGGFAYVADGGAGFQVFDVTDPRRPVQVGGAYTAGNVVAIAARGGLLFMAEDMEGFTIRAAQCAVRTTVAEPEGMAPAAPGLEVSPNPAPGRAVVRLAAARRASDLQVAIYDVTGRRVRRLHAGPAEGFDLEFAWDGADDAGRPVAGGVYFCRADADGLTLTRKLALTRASTP